MENFIFKTQKAYDLERKNQITFAMEDYIEMIFRTQKEEIRTTELATLLNIKTSSVSKMIAKLKEQDLINYEKYSLIKLTDKGKNLGAYLLKRHNVLLNLFNKINNKDSSYLVEQIEHFFSPELIFNIEEFLKLYKEWYLWKNIN